MKPEITYIECACMTTSHTLRFFKDEDTKQVYVECFLAKGTFWKRLWYALRYIAGKQSRFGAFEETILDLEAQNKIVRFLTE